MPGKNRDAGFGDDGCSKGEASTNKKILLIDFTGEPIKRMQRVVMQTAAH